MFATMISRFGVLVSLMAVAVASGCGGGNDDEQAVSDVVVEANDFMVNCLADPQGCDAAATANFAVGSYQSQLEASIITAQETDMVTILSSDVTIEEVDAVGGAAGVDICRTVVVESMTVAGEPQALIDEDARGWVRSSYSLIKLAGSDWKIDSVEETGTGVWAEGETPCGS